MIKDADNLVYTNVHKDTTLPTLVDIYIECMDSEVGVYRDPTDQKIKIAAIIRWPGYDHIWHHVVDTDPRDADYYSTLP